MKRIIIFSLLFLLILARPASAHILATDHNIGAVMHTDPDDDPIAGKPTAFFFDVKDKTNVFSPINCNCVFHILQKNKEIYTQPLFQNTTDLTSAIGSYNFTDPGEYTIQLTGTPINTATFQPFKLTYTIQVEKAVKAAQTVNSQTVWVRIFSYILLIIGVILFGSLFIRKGLIKSREQQTQKKSSEDTY